MLSPRRVRRWNNTAIVAQRLTMPIPEELTAYPQWVVWKYATTPEGKTTKLPYSPVTGQLASVNDPSTCQPMLRLSRLYHTNNMPDSASYSLTMILTAS